MQRKKQKIDAQNPLTDASLEILLRDYGTLINPPKDFQIDQQMFPHLVSRLEDFATEAMYDQLHQLASRAKDIHEIFFAKEKMVMQYFQLYAQVAFYFGQYDKAAELAGLLGNTYFINHHYETDYACQHFNKVAGRAYAKAGNHEKACHHYYQYLDSGVGARHEPGEVKEIVQYLQTHRSRFPAGLATTLAMLIKDEKQNNSLASAEELTQLHDNIFRFPVNVVARNEDNQRNIAQDFLSQSIRAISVSHDEQSLNGLSVELAIERLLDLASSLKSLKAQVSAAYNAVHQHSASYTSAIEIEYREKLAERAFIAIYKHVKEHLSAEMVERMTLPELTKLLDANLSRSGDWWSFNDSLFINYADNICRKLTSYEDFLSIHKDYRDDLFRKTGDAERLRLLTIIYPRFDEVFKLHMPDKYGWLIEHEAEHNRWVNSLRTEVESALNLKPENDKLGAASSRLFKVAKKPTAENSSLDVSPATRQQPS